MNAYYIFNAMYYNELQPIQHDQIKQYKLKVSIQLKPFSYHSISPTGYYSCTAQALHSIMAIIFAWLIGFYSRNFLSYDMDGSFKGDVITLHKNIATTLIFLVMIRIFWHYTHPAPQLPSNMSSLMKSFAHCGHLALYFMLLASPITGCLFSWSAGHPHLYYMYLIYPH